MSEINKPKGIKVKLLEESEFTYYLCPNCYEYLMIDECLECGLICEIEEDSNIDIGIKKFLKIKETIEI